MIETRASNTNRTERPSPGLFETKDLDYVYVKYRDETRLDEADFISDLNAVDWNSLKSLPDIDSMWTSFQTECRIRSDSDREVYYRRTIKSRDESDWILFSGADPDFFQRGGGG